LSKLEKDFEAMTTSYDTINILHMHHIEQCECYEITTSPCYVLKASAISQKIQNCRTTPKKYYVNLTHLSQHFCWSNKRQILLTEHDMFQSVLNMRCKKHNIVSF